MTPLEAVELAKDFGMLTSKEVYGIRFLALIQPENAICLNVGAGTGTSALAFLEARPELSKTFWTIDVNVETPFGGLKNEKNAFEKYKRQTPNQILHDSNTVDYPLYMNMPDVKFDYVFIDGNHARESVLADFYNVYQHCKYGTTIAFHDYGRDNDKTCVGVKPAIDEIVAKTGSSVVLHIDTLYAIMVRAIA